MPEQSKYTKQGYNTDGGNIFNGRGGSKKRNYKPTRKVRKSRSRTRSRIRGRMSRRTK